MWRGIRATALLTIAWMLNTGAVLGAEPERGAFTSQNRCRADLGREENFCLSQGQALPAAEGSPVSYEWKLTDSRFDLTGEVCVSGDEGAWRDLVIAIDRSASHWKTDERREKLGASGIAAAKHLIQEIRSSADGGGNASQVGVVLFSSKPGCQEYGGGPVHAGKEFPCLYVPPGSVTNEEHMNTLTGLLNQSEGLYSDRSVPRASDFEIVSSLLEKPEMKPSGAGKPGLMMLSDAVSFNGKANDPWPFLHVNNHKNARQRISQAFKGSSAAQGFELAFALSPTEQPLYDTPEAYDSMCESQWATAEDCQSPSVDTYEPSTWPVNGFDAEGYAKNLLTSTGSSTKNVVTVETIEDLDALKPALKQNSGDVIKAEAVSYSLDGGDVKAGQVSGRKFFLPNLPAGDRYKVEVVVDSGGKRMTFPLAISTKKKQGAGREFQNKEMYCAAGSRDTGFDPKDLQGGSASCGVIGDTGRAGGFIALLFLLPLLVLPWRHKRVSAVSFVLIAAFLATGVISKASFAEPATGVSALHFRPVTEGIGSTERATVLAPMRFGGGLFTDYANDPVELGGEKNKRITSVMDDLVTSHVRGSLGLFRNASASVHVPYVHRADLNRSLDGERINRTENVGLGDAAVSFKYNLRRRRNFSWALMPTVTAPTGEAGHLTGNGTTTYGLFGVFSGRRAAFSWAANVGYLHRGEAGTLDDARAEKLVVRGQSIVRGGVQYRALRWLAVAGHLQAKFSAGEPVDLTETNPAEWQASAKFLKLVPGTKLEAGFGTGLGKGFGSPDYRVYGGVSFLTSPSRSSPGRTVVRRSSQ